MMVDVEGAIRQQRRSQALFLGNYEVFHVAAKMNFEIWVRILENIPYFLHLLPQDKIAVSSR